MFQIRPAHSHDDQNIRGAAQVRWLDLPLCVRVCVCSCCFHFGVDEFNVFIHNLQLSICLYLLREPQGIIACCNPVPPLVRQYINELHLLVQEAREMPLLKVREDGWRWEWWVHYYNFNIWDGTCDSRHQHQSHISHRLRSLHRRRKGLLPSKRWASRSHFRSWMNDENEGKTNITMNRFSSQRSCCLVLTTHPGLLRAISPTFPPMVSFTLVHVLRHTGDKGLKRFIVWMYLFSELPVKQGMLFSEDEHKVGVDAQTASGLMAPAKITLFEVEITVWGGGGPASEWVDLCVTARTLLYVKGGGNKEWPRVRLGGSDESQTYYRVFWKPF